jgi:putative flippase GtrA
VSPAGRRRFIRWLRFNFVGLLGIGVQLGVLTLLVSVARLNYLFATVLAVESAVLHNFLWHERYTWRERTRGVPGVARRLLRFHLANGLISIAGNLLFMRLLTGAAGLHFLPANLLSIAMCGILNFLVGDFLVFRVRDRQRDDHPLFLG